MPVGEGTGWSRGPGLHIVLGVDTGSIREAGLHIVLGADTAAKGLS